MKRSRRAVVGDARDDPGGVFPKRSLCAGQLGAPARVERLTPSFEAVGGAAEALSRVGRATVSALQPAASLLDGRVPRGWQRDDLERPLAVARVAVRPLQVGSAGGGDRRRDDERNPAGRAGLRWALDG